MKSLSRLLILGLLSSSVFAQSPAPDPLGDLNVAPPVQPGSGGGVPANAPAVTDDWSTLEALLGRIQHVQKEALDGIEQYKASQDEAARTMLMRDIQVWHGTIEGMLLSSTWKDTVEKVRKTDDVTKSKDARYLGVFGEGGHLATVDRNQEIIRAFLKDPLAAATTGVSPTAASGQESTSAASGNPATSGNPSASGGAPDTGSAPEPVTKTGRPAWDDTASPGGSGSGGSGGSAGPAVQAPGPVQLVPNSYGVAPQVLTDAQIRAALDPLIDKELGAVNAKSAGGMQMNKYRQMTGSSGKTTVKSVGRPDYDHYREWLKASPTLKAEIDKQAQAIYDQRAGVRTPAQNPASLSDR
jgi:energy-converting hydrogenase Eha subunit F